MYKGVVIGDVHHGARDDDNIYNELNDVFMYHLEMMDQLDFIIINGDWFHSKMYLNDRACIQAITTMNKIISLAIDRKSKVRVVYGTESHDSNQYTIFNKYKFNAVDFKIITTVEEEELFPDFHVLYIPEEHIYDKKEHYKDYFNNKQKYDFVFGHGVIQEVMTYIKRDSGKKSDRLKVPVFTSAELEYICKGLVIFSHYHIYSNINDKVFYIGSFSRWQFGEEEPKGFFELTKDDDKCEALFIQNYMAETYVTLSYDQSSPIFYNENDFVKELDKVEKMVGEHMYDHIKLDIQIPMGFPNTKFITQYTKEKFKFNDSIKIEITAMDEKIRDDSQKEQLQEIIDKYACIFDKSIPIEEKISYFIKTKYDKDISIEKIKYYLYRDLNK